jgi:glucans biosynthesis protein
VLGGSSIVQAQNQPAQPLEQTQPASSPATSVQPATTPPDADQDQSAASPQQQGGSANGTPDVAPQNQQLAPNQTTPSSSKSDNGSKGDAGKSEAGTKGEGSKGEAGKSGGSGRAEGAKAEGSRSEAAGGKSEGAGAKTEGTRAEGAGGRSEGARNESSGARTEGTRGESAGGKSESGGAASARTEGVKSDNTRRENSKGAAEDAAKASRLRAAHQNAMGAGTGATGAGAAAAGQTAAAPPATQQVGVARPAPRPAPARAAPAAAFSFATVDRLAQDRASKPYRNRSTKLPDEIAKLSYDEYRDIRFQRTSSLWYDKALFEVQFFHRGFNFDRRVNISEVSGGVARPVLYNPAMFDFGPRVPKIAFPPDLGFAGFRIHYPLNTPAYKDELIVFLGASYFRVLGRNQVYGLSARGLAIDTASTSGEEFPYFTDFWLVKPEPTARTLTIYALLDSPGIAGAYQFEVRPGTTTQVQVTAQLYPRRQIAKLGIAPLTSMFFYGENSNNHHFDDFRPEVHDSDGLMTERGTGEWMWRPLVNPKDLRVNRFMDEHPRSFSLVQRDRDFNHYQDNEARYERRPSYHVEPLGDWGKGGVELVEIPSDEEIHDNIVAYWVPDAPVQPNKPMTFSYLLSAYTGTTQWPPGGKVIATHFSRVMNGTNVVPGMRRVIVDFAGGDLDSLAGAQPVQAQASASGGEIDDISVERLAANGVWRVSMRMKTNDKPVDLRCYLTLYGEALTETWTYLWSPGA